MTPIIVKTNDSGPGAWPLDRALTECFAKQTALALPATFVVRAARSRHVLTVASTNGFARIQWNSGAVVSRPLEFPSRPVTAAMLRGWPGYVTAGVVLRHATRGAAVVTAAASYVSEAWAIDVITEQCARATLTHANGAWGGYVVSSTARSGLLAAISSVGVSLNRAVALRALQSRQLPSLFSAAAKASGATGTLLVSKRDGHLAVVVIGQPGLAVITDRLTSASIAKQPNGDWARGYETCPDQPAARARFIKTLDAKQSLAAAAARALQKPAFTDM